MTSHSGDKSDDNTYDRRSVLKAVGMTGATAVGGTAATQPAAAGKSADCDPEYTVPAIYTADHIDTSWWGNVYITEGNSTRNYEMIGEPIPDDTDDLIIHCHGWRNGEDCGHYRTEITTEAYDVEGYDGTIVGLVWDSTYAWWNAKEIAELNAPKVANFITDYKADNPETTIRLQGHSLGARVVAETIYELDRQEECDLVTSAIFMAGAIDNDSVAIGGRYGRAIENVVEHAENFWMKDDTVLDWAYTTYELSSAIGNDGCDGTPPANYTDHHVQLDDHSDHYKPHVGVAGDALETFLEQGENPGSSCGTTDGTEGGDSSSSFCFITTATANDVSTLNSLRRFRDESMAATPIGRLLVWIYYRISPPIADTLERNPESRTTRVVRSLVEYCAGLSNAQDETESALKSAFLGVVLTFLYVQGILIAATGHFAHRLSDRLGRTQSREVDESVETVEERPTGTLSGSNRYFRFRSNLLQFLK